MRQKFQILLFLFLSTTLSKIKKTTKTFYPVFIPVCFAVFK